MRRFATATILGLLALPQSAHAESPYPGNAEELVAAQAKLDAINAEALVFQMGDYFRERMNAPLDRRNVGLRPSRDRIVPVSTSVAARDVTMGSSVAIELLHLDTSVLAATGAGTKDAGAPEETFLSLEIEGNEYLLDVVEVVFDPVFLMQHVLAVVINTTPDAYARFTLDSKSGFIAGTVASGEKRFRLVSSYANGAQLVFSIGSAQIDADGLITSEELVASSIVRVERRHAQAERIAEIKPDFFVHPKNGFSTILQGGAIGNVDVARLLEPQVVAQLLKDLSVFTRATGDEEFEILSVSRRDDQGRRRVSFRQLIGGIPVDFQSKLEVGPGGDVWHLIAQVIDPSGAPESLLSEQEARKVAIEAIERQVGPLENATIDWIPAELMYVAKAVSQEDFGIALTATWRLPARITTTNEAFHAQGKAVLVVINAETAEASVMQNTELHLEGGIPDKIEIYAARSSGWVHLRLDPMAAATHLPWTALPGLGERCQP